MINLQRHTDIALGYFFTAALLGIVLRMFFVTEIPANFRYVVHGHSHIALLGWVYLALTTLIYRMYFFKSEKSKTYLKIFWFTNITLIGMLFTFPFTGYALFSIIFSTLFLFASYFFAWFVMKNIPKQYKYTKSWKLIKAALWYLVISSIGPWAIGGVMATLGNTSIWYKLSIYFYLHFQYNAWFILALIGILFFIFEKFKIQLDRKLFKSFFLLINAGLILSLFLSALWVEPPLIIYILAAAGSVLQLIAFYKLFLILKKSWSELQEKLKPFINFLLKLCGILLTVKILLQLLTAIPLFSELSALYTDFVIGYLHWTFLGVVSISLFSFLKHFQLLKLRKTSFWLYFIGFILSELLIFYKGTSAWLGLPFFENYFIILVSVSALMPVGVGFLILKNLVLSPRPLPRRGS